MTKKHPNFVFALIFLLVFGSFASIAPTAEAQSGEWEWGRVSRSLRAKINNLDRDRVDNLPIHILFGVTPAHLTRNFGDPRGGGTRLHEGHDTMAPRGALIVSPTEAVVIRVGNGSSSGRFVTTANPGGETFVYMHLDDVADIRAGDVLDPGDLIGYVGNTGNASGGAPHLHFEIRKDRRALDPYPRLTREFTPREKIRFLEAIFDEADDEDELAEFLVREYRTEFVRIQASGVELPREILSLLPGGTAGRGVLGIVRDLEVGAQGEDVRELQGFLVGKGYLTADSMTGYFGPLTQAAVMRYQTDRGVSPVSGYVGPLTRAAIGREAGAVAATGMSNAELRAKIAELEVIVAQLTRQLGEMQAR